ncbi:hypothetical protein LXL04_020079 [Taraxacum kok-saghyz]
MLSNSNYTAWSIKMKMYMHAQEVWDSSELKNPQNLVGNIHTCYLGFGVGGLKDWVKLLLSLTRVSGLFLLRSCWICVQSNDRLLRLLFFRYLLVIIDNEADLNLVFSLIFGCLFVAMTGETPPGGGYGSKVPDPNEPAYLLSSDLSSVSIISFKLTRTNKYNAWASATELAVRGRNKLCFANGYCVKPNDDPYRALIWDGVDAVVQYWLVASVSESIHSSHIMILIKVEFEGHIKDVNLLVLTQLSFSVVGLKDWAKLLLVRGSRWILVKSEGYCAIVPYFVPIVREKTKNMFVPSRKTIKSTRKTNMVVEEVAEFVEDATTINHVKAIVDDNVINTPKAIWIIGRKQYGNVIKSGEDVLKKYKMSNVVDTGAATPQVREKLIGSSNVTCPMLTPTNYTVWAMRMKVVLRIHKAWIVIEPGTDQNEGKDCLAMGLLYQSLPESLIMQIGDIESSKSLWEAIKARHVGADRVKEARLQTLTSEFDRLKMQESDTIDTFAGKLSGISSQSASLGESIEESKMVKKLLKSVPRRFIHIVASLEKVLDLKTVRYEDVVGRLKAYAERIR